MNISINYLAVLVAGIVAMAIGALWYSPLLLGKAWMKAAGKSMGDMPGSQAKGYVISFVSLLVMAYVLAHFVSLAGVVTTSGAWQLAFWLWLGFFATTMLGAVLWDGKPMRLYWINSLHYLLVLVVMSWILVAWH